jgi:hypothetical protein
MRTRADAAITVSAWARAVCRLPDLASGLLYVMAGAINNEPNYSYSRRR